MSKKDSGEQVVNGSSTPAVQFEPSPLLVPNELDSTVVAGTSEPDAWDADVSVVSTVNAAVATSAAKMPGYHEAGAWRGIQKWECDDCPYDSLQEHDLREHIVTHAAVFARQAAGGLVDAKGKPLAVRVEGE